MRDGEVWRQHSGAESVDLVARAPCAADTSVPLRPGRRAAIDCPGYAARGYVRVRVRVVSGGDDLAGAGWQG